MLGYSCFEEHAMAIVAVYEGPSFTRANYEESERQPLTDIRAEGPAPSTADPDR